MMGRLLTVQKIHKVIPFNSLRIEIEPSISHYFFNTKYVDQFITTYTQKTSYDVNETNGIKFTIRIELRVTPKFALSI